MSLANLLISGIGGLIVGVVAEIIFKYPPELAVIIAIQALTFLYIFNESYTKEAQKK